jgi:hypothetical protein
MKHGQSKFERVTRTRPTKGHGIVGEARHLGVQAPSA